MTIALLTSNREKSIVTFTTLSRLWHWINRSFPYPLGILWLEYGRIEIRVEHLTMQKELFKFFFFLWSEQAMDCCQTTQECIARNKI
jgi:hypothetical protein